MLGSCWHIRLLGGLSAERASQPVVRFQTRKTGGVLAFLAYHMPSGLARDLIIDQYWPSLDLDGGRNCLATSLTSLRRQLEPPDVPAGSVVISTRLDVRLNPASVTTDVQELRALAEPVSDANSDEDCIRAGARAVEVYRGYLLPGSYEDWVEAERDRLTAIFVRLSARALIALERRGDQERALEFALAAAGAAPDQESTHRDVIRLYRGLGRDLDALRQYKLLEERMQETWGHAPSSATRSLLDGLGIDHLAQRRLMRQSRQKNALTNTSTPASVRPSPAPAAESPRPSLQTPALPAPITNFFGREEELDYLRNAFAPPGEEGASRQSCRARLLTITGPAGAGKTRLALEAARTVASSFDGAAFVPLSNVTDECLLDEAVLASVGAKPAHDTAPREHVLNALSGKTLLFVLDNAEHLGSAVGDFADELLSRLPNLSVLVTSRMPLGLPGERLMPLRPLPTPAEENSTESLLQFACVRMFLDRAQAASPDFQLTSRNAGAVASVCGRLEGIPLAIELAAARISALTPSQMLAELEERFRFLVTNKRTVEERHKTLDAALRWSYELLPPSTQRFFARLSVFRDGWTLATARAVWPSDQEEQDALEQMERLIEQALIFADDVGSTKRFRMLESVREFVESEIAAEERGIAFDLLSCYVKDLVDREALRLRGPESADAVATIQPDLGNIRAVLSANASNETGLRLCAGLWRFWSVMGQALEGVKFLTDALAACPSAPLGLQAAARNGVGVLLRYLRRYEEAVCAGQLALELARKSGDRTIEADALNLLAVLSDEQGNSADSRTYLDEALTIRRELGDVWSVAGALNNLGRTAHREGDLIFARKCYEESQAFYKLMKDWSKAAIVLTNLGVTADELGDFAGARAAYEQSLMIFRELGIRHELGTLLYNLGESMLRGSNHPDAERYFHESIRELLAQGDLASLATPITSLGTIAFRSGELTRALRLYGAAEALSELYGRVLNSNYTRAIGSEIAAIKSQLPNYDFEAAWQFGRSLSLDQAVAFACTSSSDGIQVTNDLHPDFSCLPVINPSELRLPVPA
jgi:predicted ATPase/DNA-binding SARP family transcriptional activator